MINVLSLVSYPFLPARVGGEKAIAHFYRHLSSAVSLTCVTIKKNEPRAAQGYEVFNILSNSPLRYANVFYFFALKRIIREKHITHLLIEHPYYGWLAVLLKSFTGVKLVVRSHNIEGLRWKTLNKWWWGILLRYEQWTHRRANYNFFIQEEDLQYAIKNFGLQPEKCLIVTYGVNRKSPPSDTERNAAREQLLLLHGIPRSHAILLFNGSFNYLPNLNALLRILQEINPLLQQRHEFAYTLLVCGKDIPQRLQDQSFPNVIFAGFVTDISLYCKGAGIFLNPVTEGGGIKTKIVEAIELGATVVSARSGATGMNITACGDKLVMVNDNNPQAFAEAVIKQSEINRETPQAFFDHYSWYAITQRTVNFLNID